MAPEEKARLVIDRKLEEAGWIIQDMKDLDPSAGLGVAIREYPTDTGEVDYALFVDGRPVGVVEAKRTEAGENITTVEAQTARYANSKLKYIKYEFKIRFAYEATDKIIRFTDYNDIKYRSRQVFSFFQPTTLSRLTVMADTIRNNLKRMPKLLTRGFRDCQIAALNNLDKSFAENRPKALVQMATGAGKTFTAITASYRLLKHCKFKRILFLADTRSLAEQAEREFKSYHPVDDSRTFGELYSVLRLRKSHIPNDVEVCVSTIQRMYSILKGEELDESAEDFSVGKDSNANSQVPKQVVYNKKYPPEFFDCIIVDECHRSIYNVWSQVLEYFDAFLVGLTATPDKRTLAYFNENIVSEYTREQAIVDGVNVGEDIFIIDTEISQKGGKILKQAIEKRNRLSREKRLEVMEEDYEYDSKQLDKAVVNPSQIRTVIRTFKDALKNVLYPERDEVPKTLIFAKTDSHADDIINIVREEFAEGNEFCKKITCAADKPEEALAAFRNEFYPRIAVTVDMIATGTDVKPIECLIFMRDVRSKGYFEQMKGRGTRTISKEDLQKVSPSAKDGKDRFIIIDAVGVTKSRKTDTRPLERKPSVSLKQLMINVALGAKDEDTLTSLANRIIRLGSRMDKKEHKEFREVIGASTSKIAGNLLDAFDEDKIREAAERKFYTGTPSRGQMEEIQKDMLKEATKPFYNPQNRNFIEKIQNSHDQIIDSVNIDEVVFAGFEKSQKQKADEVISSFRDFIKANRNELIALGIIYSRRYKERPMVIAKLKELYQQLKVKGIGVQAIWDSYAVEEPQKIPKGTKTQLTDLVALIRYETGRIKKLEPFADRVRHNFMKWTFKENIGSDHFSEEQLEWLRLIRDHIIASLSIVPEDLERSPFDSLGGMGRFYVLFGENYEKLLHELNVKLVA